MSVQRENRPFFWEARAYSAEPSFLYPPEWNGCTGVPTLDALLDTRNVAVASNSAIAVKPAIQLAAVRADRPDDGLVVGGTWTGGAAEAGLLHFHEATILPAATKLLFRVGIGFKLTAGTFGRAEGVLYSSYRSLGLTLPGEEVVVNPYNATTEEAHFPLGGGRIYPSNGLTALKLAVFTMGNLSATTDWAPIGRAFNDPLARGPFTVLGTWITDVPTGNDARNTGERSVSGLAPDDNHWFEPGVAVRKADSADPASRVIFRVIPALKYS